MNAPLIITVLSKEEYHQRFNKRFAGLTRAYLVQPLHSNNTSTVVIIPVDNTRHLFLFAAKLPQPNLHFDRQKNMVPTSRFHFTHEPKVCTNPFIDIINNVAANTIENLSFE